MNHDTSDPTLRQTPGAEDAPGRGADQPERANGAEPSDGSPGAAGDHGPPASDGEAAELAGELDELVRTAAQRDEYLALAQRTQADFENFRKRVARDAAVAQERGVARLVKELLPALDNLDRALEDAGARGEQDPLLEGVRLVRGELTAALARVGVESFSPLAEPFDPALHEAMAQHPVEGAAAGTVTEVYQPGYRLGEHVIRPARVVVAA
jgi:molecular chaperone GrpE